MRNGCAHPPPKISSPLRVTLNTVSSCRGRCCSSPPASRRRGYCRHGDTPPPPAQAATARSLRASRRGGGSGRAQAEGAECGCVGGQGAACGADPAADEVLGLVEGFCCCCRVGEEVGLGVDIYSRKEGTLLSERGNLVPVTFFFSACLLLFFHTSVMDWSPSPPCYFQAGGRERTSPGAGSGREAPTNVTAGVGLQVRNGRVRCATEGARLAPVASDAG